jgi:hypothetical protein
MNISVPLHLIFKRKKKMKKFQSAPNCFCGVFIVVFGVFNNLHYNAGFHRYEIGFLAGFLFFIGFPLFLQMNKLNIPYNFKYNKTLHI